MLNKNSLRLGKLEPGSLEDNLGILGQSVVLALLNVRDTKKTQSCILLHKLLSKFSDHTMRNSVSGYDLLATIQFW